MAIQTETPAIVPAPGLALPSDGSTFGTLFDLNLIGLWTLYKKEVWRFWKVMTQTILAPVISTLQGDAMRAVPCRHSTPSDV